MLPKQRSEMFAQDSMYSKLFPCHAYILLNGFEFTL
jgi:hypothetical protein